MTVSPCFRVGMSAALKGSMCPIKLVPGLHPVRDRCKVNDLAGWVGYHADMAKCLEDYGLISRGKSLRTEIKHVRESLAFADDEWVWALQALLVFAACDTFDEGVILQDACSEYEWCWYMENRPKRPKRPKRMTK